MIHIDLDACVSDFITFGYYLFDEHCANDFRIVRLTYFSKSSKCNFYSASIPGNTDSAAERKFVYIWQYTSVKNKRKSCQITNLIVLSEGTNQIVQSKIRTTILQP